MKVSTGEGRELGHCVAQGRNHDLIVQPNRWPTFALLIVKHIWRLPQRKKADVKPYGFFDACFKKKIVQRRVEKGVDLGEWA